MTPPLRTWPNRAASAATLALLFAAALAWGGGQLEVERALFLAVGRAGASIGAPLLLLTRLGNLVLLGPISLLLSILLARWRGGWIALLYAAATLLGRLLVELVKRAVQRPRPALLPHLDHVAGWSFPSAHSANSMIVFLLAALLWRDRRLAAAALVLVLTIGASRVMLAVHWPSDVLGGWSLGGLWALACDPLLSRAAPPPSPARAGSPGRGGFHRRTRSLPSAPD